MKKGKQGRPVFLERCDSLSAGRVDRLRLCNERMSMFLDTAKISVKAGRGGDGMVPMAVLGVATAEKVALSFLKWMRAFAPLWTFAIIAVSRLKMVKKV